jgi:hypothetical protein
VFLLTVNLSPENSKENIMCPTTASLAIGVVIGLSVLSVSGIVTAVRIRRDESTPPAHDREQRLVEVASYQNRLADEKCGGMWLL